MFTKKQLQISIALAKGTFDNQNNAIILPPVPMHVEVDKTGGTELPTLKASIQNLSLDLMQQLTVLAFRNLQTYNNVIKVEAGEEGQALDLVFQGEITSAVPVFDSSGSVTFNIDAKSGFYPLQKVTSPVSVNGGTEIAVLFQMFAEEAKYSLENNGVTGSVKNCIFTGSPIDKARQLAKQTGVDLIVDNNTFVIMPDYLSSKDENTVPLLRKDTGMIGYPAFTNSGIKASCLFSPLLSVGGMVKIESVVPKATGVWRITKIHHTLDANSPDSGEWVSEIEGEWLSEK